MALWSFGLTGEFENVCVFSTGSGGLQLQQDAPVGDKWTGGCATPQAGIEAN